MVPINYRNISHVCVIGLGLSESVTILSYCVYSDKLLISLSQPNVWHDVILMVVEPPKKLTSCLFYGPSSKATVTQSPFITIPETRDHQGIMCREYMFEIPGDQRRLNSARKCYQVLREEFILFFFFFKLSILTVMF